MTLTRNVPKNTNIAKRRNKGYHDGQDIHFSGSGVDSSRADLGIQVSHFLGALRGEHEIGCTAHDGLRAVEIIQAVYA